MFSSSIGRGTMTVSLRSPSRSYTTTSESPSSVSRMISTKRSPASFPVTTMRFALTTTSPALSPASAAGPPGVTAAMLMPSDSPSFSMMTPIRGRSESNMTMPGMSSGMTMPNRLPGSVRNSKKDMRPPRSERSAARSSAIARSTSLRASRVSSSRRRCSASSSRSRASSRRSIAVSRSPSSSCAAAGAAIPSAHTIATAVIHRFMIVSSNALRRSAPCSTV